jgi:ComEC/Rec2-related protein
VKFFPNSFIALNVYILLGATCFYIGGILSATCITPYFYLYILLSLAPIAGIISHVMGKKIPTGVLIVLASFALGHIRYKQQCSSFYHFHNNYQETAKAIKGVITTIEPVEHARMKQCAILHLNELQTNTGDWKPIDVYIQLYTPTINAWMVSDKVQINNIAIKKPSSESFLQYLIKEGLTSTVFCLECDYILIDRPEYSFYRWLFVAKQNVFQRLRNKMPAKSFALFSSLFLGNRSLNKQTIDTLANQFKQWGISHYLARSGLHLTIFALIWHILFRLLPICFLFKQAILLALSIIYFALSWPSVSFLRAFYSFLLCILCNMLSMRTHFLHILTLVTLFVLFFNPIQLFFLDFQLSFSLTFGLAWINHLYLAYKPK